MTEEPWFYNLVELSPICIHCSKHTRLRKFYELSGCEYIERCIHCNCFNLIELEESHGGPYLILHKPKDQTQIEQFEAVEQSYLQKQLDIIEHDTKILQSALLLNKSIIRQLNELYVTTQKCGSPDKYTLLMLLDDIFKNAWKDATV